MSSRLTLITGYVDPDLDAVSSALAYEEYLQPEGQPVVAGFIGSIHEEAQYVLRRFSIRPPLSIEDAARFERIILVDASDIVGLGGKIRPERVIEIIDHRKVNEADKFRNADRQIELVGAAATLIAEKFMRRPRPISVNSARLLVAAIISNTLNFQGSVTTDRDRAAASWLNQTAQLPADFWQDLFAAKSVLDGPKLEQRLRHDFAFFNFGPKKIGAAQLEIIGAQGLLTARQTEIEDVLRALDAEHGLDFSFLNCVSLDEGAQYFVTTSAELQEILTQLFSLRFVRHRARHSGLLLRKQIMPHLVQYFATKK